jgi:hypothetical protein
VTVLSLEIRFEPELIPTMRAVVHRPTKASTAWVDQHLPLEPRESQHIFRTQARLSMPERMQTDSNSQASREDDAADRNEK